ncbi:MAG: peptidoglycan recognition protein family protein [Clostridium sp.]
MKKKKGIKKHKRNKKLIMFIIVIISIAVLSVAIYLNLDGYYFNYIKDSKKVLYKSLEGLESNLKGALNIIQVDYEWSSTLVNDNEPNKLIIHHTVGDKLSPEQIHNDHKSKGYDGIGYHYYIRKSGDIYKGRPDEAQGAHTIGENRKSIAICLEGNFENQKLTDKQEKSLITLSKYLVVKYNLYTIIGHKDAYNTLCPGKNISIESINNNIKKYFLDKV